MSFIDQHISDLHIEEKLKSLVYIDNPKEESVQWGMNYMFFAPSKRVRPLLTLESNLCFAAPDDDSYILAAATELIHTYSLIHDDLPCMDDAPLRRGVATLHSFRSEAYALLVGDALLTAGLGMLGRYSKSDRLARLLRLYHDKAGYEGMIYGQQLDMNGETRRLSLEETKLMEINKTSRLLQLSLVSGAINGGASEEYINIMDKLGESMGLIFQIRDDILDETATAAELGKPTGSDEENNKSSVTAIIGVDNAQAMIKDLSAECFELTDKLPGNREFFRAFVKYLAERNK